MDTKNSEVQQIKVDMVNFAHSWWGQQWIHSILDIGRPYRMQRGLQYAQEDRVQDLTITSGQIFALVEGKMSPTPYRVKINFEPVPEEGWTKIFAKMGEKIKYSIELLQNQLPRDLIPIFRSAGYYLFPPPPVNLMPIVLAQIKRFRVNTSPPLFYMLPRLWISIPFYSSNCVGKAKRRFYRHCI